MAPNFAVICNGCEEIFSRKKIEFKQIAIAYGACIANDHITVLGNKVGCMCREQPPDSVPADNGWRFFSGEESQEYVDNADNSNFYDTNTIANNDITVTPFLDSPVGSAFSKNKKEIFVEES